MNIFKKLWYRIRGIKPKYKYQPLVNSMQLKKKLKGCSKNELIKIVINLYAESTQIKEYYENKYLEKAGKNNGKERVNA